MEESKVHNSPIPFSPPRIDEKSIAEVADTLRSGWITTGPKTKEFEKRIAKYCNVPKVLCLNSATAAMQMALKFFGVGRGDEVIVPAYTYCATANVVLHCGAKPVMVDIDPHDFNISLDAIKAAISPATKAIIPVDIAGWPCDYNRLMEIIQEAGNTFVAKNDIQQKLGRILLLSDAAHSFGALYNDEPVGRIADFSAFSFHAVKNLTTAEGGALIINLPEHSFDLDSIYKELSILSLHGQSKDALAKLKPGAWRYDVHEAGFKCNMTDINASLGLVELGRYKENLSRRAEIVSMYTQRLSQLDWAIIPPFESETKRSSYHLFLLRIKGFSEGQRDLAIQRMAERNIATNVHFLPIPMLSYYKNLGYRIDEYPNAYAAFSNEISLPLYFNLKDEEVNRILDSIISIVESIL